MTDESLDEQLDGVARHLQASVAEALDVEAGLGAVLRAHRKTPRDRVVAAGRRSDDGRRCELLVVWEHDGSWTLHAPPLGSAGVTLSRVEALSLAASIIERDRPVSGESRHRWRDACGVPIREGCRVEQVAVATEHGALPARVPRRGEVTGRGGGFVTVLLFDTEGSVVSVRPHLLRVLDAPGS